MAEKRITFQLKKTSAAKFSPRIRYRARKETDPATGLFRCQVFYQRLQRYAARPENLPCKLIVLDINRFKQINELFGVQTGDLVLRFMGESIRELLREGEFAGHLWCDIFAICVRRGDEEADEFIGRINGRVNELPLDFDFIISAGILKITQYGGEEAEVLCSRAEQAMETVKGDYLNRVAFYDGSIQQGFTKIHFLVSNMSAALERGEFTAFLQPQIDLRSGGVVSAEALVRWRKDGRIIPPNEFIPLFEKNSFVLKLDEYIWEQACKLLSGWWARGISPRPVSVNVSRIHVYDSRFCEKIQTLLQKYGLSPKLIPLEITESIYVEDFKQILTLMKQMKEQGFLFEIDDFGSGYSSLSMLQELPVDRIKLDMRFLKASQNEHAGRVIIKAVIDAARQLGVSVLAEGVETEEQVCFLKEAGCDLVQGYYYGKPMPIKKFETEYLGFKD